MNKNPMLKFTGRTVSHRAAGITNAVYDLACVPG